MRASEVRVLGAGMLGGHGDVAGTAMDLDALGSGSGPSWREDGFNRLRVFGTLMPRGGDLVTHGYVNIMPGGKLLFDVTENGGAATGRLRVGTFFDDEPTDGALVISKGAFLELNVAQGYYGQDFRRDLRQHHRGRCVPPAPQLAAEFQREADRRWPVADGQPWLRSAGPVHQHHLRRRAGPRAGDRFRPPGRQPEVTAGRAAVRRP
ncbi:hypothetical protein G6F68_014191 [Rhizopus microsporus]|nr:hypothetical protein G6F68_014191 [Rhizopus microsporus]